MINDFDFQGVKFKYMVVWDVSNFYCKETYIVEGAFQTEYSAKDYFKSLQKKRTINKNHRFIIKVDDNGKVSKLK